MMRGGCLWGSDEMNIDIVTTWHEGGAGYVSRAYMNALQKQRHVSSYK